jgi:hypothetical protein
MKSGRVVVKNEEVLLRGDGLLVFFTFAASISVPPLQGFHGHDLTKLIYPASPDYIRLSDLIQPAERRPDVHATLLK